MPRVLLLLATRTYRADDFLAAAESLGIEVVVGTDQRQVLQDLVPESTLEVDFSDPEGSARTVLEFARGHPLDAVVAAEDDGAILAARVSEALDLPHNPPDAVRSARYKHWMREALSEAGIRSPGFTVYDVDDDPVTIADRVPYPCVLKPVHLAASRGVIRADDPDRFVAAFRRIRRLLDDPDVRDRDPAAARWVLVEDFIPGAEVALEGLLSDGRLRVLALFDKPDPLEGPYFEESYYVTPSRLPADDRDRVVQATRDTARALGLLHGPIHAELRINDVGAWMLEVAPRSIGGLCSRTLRFGAGISLEELILRHAVGMSIDDLARESAAAGVLMLPTPRAGILREVKGVDAAKDVEGIEGVTISVPRGQPVTPLPEGHRYLGFVFARGPDPESVEAALREAHRRLEPEIEPPSD